MIEALARDEVVLAVEQGRRRGQSALDGLHAEAGQCVDCQYEGPQLPPVENEHS